MIFINNIKKAVAWAVYWYITWWRDGSTAYTTTDRITFSTWITAANTVSNLSQGRFYQSWTWVSDKVLYWYWCGWYTLNSYVATCDRIVFSTWVTSARTAANLSTSRYYPWWLSDGATYWYFAWWHSTTRTELTDRITFSTSTTAANTASNLSVARYCEAAISDGVTYWYFSWWSSGSNVKNTLTDRIVFSTSITSAYTTWNLPVWTDFPTWLSDGSIYWYSLWGRIGWDTNTAAANRITFSTWIYAANTASNLSSARHAPAASSDWAINWYIWWWYSSWFSNTTDRLVFSTWVASANTASNLSNSKYMASWLADFAI